MENMFKINLHQKKQKEKKYLKKLSIVNQLLKRFKKNLLKRKKNNINRKKKRNQNLLKKHQKKKLPKKKLKLKKNKENLQSLKMEIKKKEKLNNSNEKFMISIYVKNSHKV